MRNRIFFAAVISALLLASCGITKNNDFTSRKYTKFRKGEANIASISFQDLSERTNPDLVETANISVKTDIPVIVSSPLTKTVSDKQPLKTLTADNFNSISKKVSIEKKREIKLKSTRSNVLSRLAGNPNTTSVNSDDRVLLVILAILAPPLAVYLARGIGTEFWISVILWFCLILPGIIYAILVVLDEI